MKIKIQELLETYQTDWGLMELMSSLTGEVINDAIKGNEEYDFKLLVNGKELEPIMLARILSNMEEYIKREAVLVAQKRFTEQSEAIIELLDNNLDTTKELLSDLEDKYKGYLK